MLIRGMTVNNKMGQGDWESCQAAVRPDHERRGKLEEAAAKMSGNPQANTTGQEQARVTLLVGRVGSTSLWRRNPGAAFRASDSVLPLQ